ncbi:MAG: hypothetical protein PHN72_00540 [Bacilli bacterium]|nr:hypothetical protein [Bacilli bacterium]
MNKKLGKYGTVITGTSVLLFGLSMIVGLFKSTIFVSCLLSMFIAIGYLLFIIALNTHQKDADKNGLGMAGITFGIIYATIIFLVYYAECTTIRLQPNLSKEILSIISYAQTGSLFFNYDLLGYAFMGLSTFFISFTIHVENRVGSILKKLLCIHGIFFLSCLFIPMFPIFTNSTNNIMGTIILEIWCLYFLPICILGYQYFKNMK